jgi:TonB family protein
MHNKVRNSLYIFIVASLFIHLGVWTSLKFAPTPSFLEKKENVEIVILDQSQPKKMMQIVEQNDQPLNDETPEDAKYMSAHNQKVLKETRAKEQGEFKNTAGKGGANSPSPQKVAQKNSGKVKKSDGNLPSLSDLRPTYDLSSTHEVQPATGAGSPASQTNDYLKETTPSLETVLNTREFVYFSYYQRIRTQIRQYWEPSIREKVKKIFAEGRTIASEKDHITRVIITLDRQGALVKVQVVGESGLKDLDDAAVEAFRAAEPFPNPPKGIVEKDGTIKINWDFVLEANNGSFFTSQRYARSP